MTGRKKVKEEDMRNRQIKEKGRRTRRRRRRKKRRRKRRKEEKEEGNEYKRKFVDDTKQNAKRRRMKVQHKAKIQSTHG